MPETSREAVAVFDDTKTLDDAVYALETHGFDRAAFSLLASEQAVSQKLGHRYQQVKEVEDEPKVPRETFFSRASRLEADYLPAPVLASIGALAFFGVGSVLPVVVAAGAGAASAPLRHVVKGTRECSTSPVPASWMPSLKTASRRAESASTPMSSSGLVA